MSNCFPPYNNSSENIKVELYLSNNATKKDIKNITHIDAGGFASKTNFAVLKTEVDKIDADKLKTVPGDLAKLSNVAKNDVAKKTDYNTKVSNIESQIAAVNKNALDNLADINPLKTKTVDTSNFVNKTKFSTDTNALNDKIDKVDKKVPDISGLATKTSLTAYLQTPTFNSKITEVENKIAINHALTKVAGTKINNIETDLDGFKKSDLTGYAKKTEVANDTTTIRNDYATNASVDSEINDLKAQHIADEVKKVDDKAKKNARDILRFESRLKQKEDTVNENERGISFITGLFFYIDQSNLVYDWKMGSFQFTAGKISTWKSTGIFNYLDNSNMNAVGDSKSVLPELKNDGRMHVSLSGNHFQQNKVIIPNNNNLINIYCVYKIDPIASTRDDTFTVQNALFGAMEITKNADTSKYNYNGYGICFDEGGTFSHTIREDNFDHTTNARNVLIFRADMSFSTHKTNKANNIYVMSELFVQGINDTTLYAEKKFNRNFTDPGKKFLLSLHYSGDNSYLFVNGRQELKFKAKTDQLVKEKLCIGNLSDQWTASESEKTGLNGNIYDFVVDYKSINGVKPIYDMHRYLMTKLNISP